MRKIMLIPCIFTILLISGCNEHSKSFPETQAGHIHCIAAGFPCRSVGTRDHAAKIVEYRIEDLRIKKTRNIAGLNLESELPEAGAALAKAEPDYFSAQMNYRTVLSELKTLTGNY
jgi:hypothetical protein